MFDGFQESDFLGIAGTTWRGRAMLGGALIKALRPEIGSDCDSWGVRRRLELHIARRAAYDFDDPYPYAKLFVYTTDQLAYGFYVEATGKLSEDAKYPHWRNLRKRLRTDDALRQAFSTALNEHNLGVADYYRRQDTGGALRGQFRSQDGRIRWRRAGESNWQDSSFDELVERVTAMDGDHWIDLHVFAEMDRATAIHMGRQIDQPITAVLSALAPVYRAASAD